MRSTAIGFVLQEQVGAMELPKARFGLLMFAFAGLVGSLAQAAQFSVEAVKAAYLFRFAQYVEWPETTPADAPFVIGVTGAEDVAVHLERLLPGMTVNGRPATLTLAALLTRVKQATCLPVTYADVWEYWLRAPQGNFINKKRAFIKDLTALSQ